MNDAPLEWDAPRPRLADVAAHVTVVVCSAISLALLIMGAVR